MSVITKAPELLNQAAWLQKQALQTPATKTSSAVNSALVSPFIYSLVISPHILALCNDKSIFCSSDVSLESIHRRVMKKKENPKV